MLSLLTRLLPNQERGRAQKQSRSRGPRHHLTSLQLFSQTILAIVTLVLLCTPSTLAAKGKSKSAADKVRDRANASIERLVNLRTHSIYPPYIDQDLQNRWWDFGGDAYINTNKYIRLTRNTPSQMGWLWSRLPLTAQHYVIEIEFKISGDTHHLYGDGLAIWLTKSRAQPGPVFGSIDKFDGFAIFIDTYSNGRHAYGFPHIVGMLGDGQTAYDHDNDGDANSLGYCSATLRRTNVDTKIKLTYIKDSYLDVKVQHRAWNDWTDCFRVDNISLPFAPFLGLTALTGDVHDAHDVISVTTSSAFLSDSTDPNDKSRSRSTSSLYSSSSSGSWMGFLFKLFLFIGVCVGAMYGYQEYNKRNYGGSFGGRRRGGGVGLEFWKDGRSF